MSQCGRRIVLVGRKGMLVHIRKVVVVVVVMLPIVQIGKTDAQAVNEFLVLFLHKQVADFGARQIGNVKRSTALALMLCTSAWLFFVVAQCIVG